MAKGIDIYRYQTVTNWQAVKNSGVGYIWVKLTDGGGPAVVKGDKQVAGSKSVGIPVGGYHFCQADSGTPEHQADVFIAEVRRLGATGLVPMLDLEDNPTESGRPDIPDSQKRAWGIRFCNRVAWHGFRPGVYVNNSVAKLTRPDGWGIPGLVIWIARYGAKPDTAAGRYDIHQYSSTGSVAGITGSVDMNESYTNNHFTSAAPPEGDDDMPLSGNDFKYLLYDNSIQDYGNLSQLLSEIKDKSRAAAGLATSIDKLTQLVVADAANDVTPESLAAALKGFVTSDIAPIVRETVAAALKDAEGANSDEIADKILNKLAAKIAA